MTSDLNPPVGSLDLSVPAIVCVVSHLVAAVLTEADTLLFDSNVEQELVSPGQEVSKGLILQNSLVKSLPDRVVRVGAQNSFLLVFCSVKRQLEVSDCVDLGVIFVLGVNKMLDLSHRELTHAQETLSR